VSKCKGSFSNDARRLESALAAAPSNSAASSSVSSDEDLRVRRDRIEDELRAKVDLAEREYHAAVAEYKRRLQIHADSEDSPDARQAIAQATRAHHIAVGKYGEVLREFNHLIVNSDLLNEP
jgi:hypothetical protein